MAFTGAHRRRSDRRWIKPTAIAAIVLIVVALAAGVVAVAVALSGEPRLAVRASSQQTGTDLDALTTGSSSKIEWRSKAPAVGEWVELDWSGSIRVDHLVLAGASRHTLQTGRLTFSDGSSLLVTPDSHGAVNLTFPARTVTTARLTVAQPVNASEPVQLSSFEISTKGPPSSTGGPVHAFASSVAARSSAAALLDGRAANGDLGREWLANPAASSAKAGVSWRGLREVASVRLWGPSAAAYDPAYSAAAALNGYVIFSDGSRVRVSGVAGGNGVPTTISFTPRVVSSVTVDLQRTVPQATIGLRGLAMYEGGHTPPPTSSAAAQSLMPAKAGACSTTSQAVGTPADEVVALVCPSVGSSVDGAARLVVAVHPNTVVRASAVPADANHTLSVSALSALAESTADANGRAVLQFSTKTLSSGPIAIHVTAPYNSTIRPLDVQMYNLVGRGSKGPAHRGGTLAWDDEFDHGISISGTGKDATYAAFKPEYYGGSQFGAAVFDDPASGAGTFSVVDDKYLRISVAPIGDRSDPQGYGRKHLGGLLSSLHVGATGFSAQYGYFEARMMAPSGYGTWPAFWMMNDDSATKSSTSTEVDAVELYGNRTKQTCHAIHNYIGKKDRSTVKCITSAVRDDWALGWHTYAVDIEPGQARFFVDGALVMTETGLQNSSDPFFFMANLALGGGWPVDLAPAGNRADLWIDYIRVYV